MKVLTSLVVAAPVSPPPLLPPAGLFPDSFSTVNLVSSESPAACFEFEFEPLLFVDDDDGDEDDFAPECSNEDFPDSRRENSRNRAPHHSWKSASCRPVGVE